MLFWMSCKKRDPFYETSAALLAAAETDQIQGYIAAHSVNTLFYLIQKGKSSSSPATLKIINQPYCLCFNRWTSWEPCKLYEHRNRVNL
jgi:hypothetical protein